jgi:hypothetical protein
MEIIYMCDNYKKLNQNVKMSVTLDNCIINKSYWFYMLTYQEYFAWVWNVDIVGVLHYPATNDSCYSFYSEIQGCYEWFGWYEIGLFFKCL